MIDHVQLYAAEFWPALHGRDGPLVTLMRQNQLHSVFQPIVDLKSATVHAHEALIRGPADDPLHGAEALLAAAQSEGLLYEFELFSLHTALSRWGALGQPGRLFLNISAQALSRLVEMGGARMLAQAMRDVRVSPHRVILEITEHERVGDMAALVEMARDLHAEGVALALDDYGDGRSSLRLWSELRPDIVKIDRYFSHGIDTDTDRLKIFQILLHMADLFGAELVAEGIEREAELRVIRDLGVSYGQGFFLGHPGAVVQAGPAHEARGVLQDSRVAVLPEQRYATQRGPLQHLSVIHAPVLTPAANNDKAAELFQAHPGLHALAVLEGHRPCAILNRHQFMDRYAAPYFREIHGRKSCMQVANREPRIIERDHDIGQLLSILTSQDQRYLSDGFIVTDHGRYVGLGTGEQLVRSVTEMRIEAARHANPLTSLPGNIPLNEHVKRLLESGGAFAACYLDLDNFKPFNDHYGYSRGDEMIRLLARVTVAHCDAQRDFVGHIGGDDFLVLFQSKDWQARCALIVAEFNQQAKALYDEQDRLCGGIEAEDRHGVRGFIPCTTVSIGAVQVAGGQYRDAEALASQAAQAKHQAKIMGGLHVMAHA
jgi:diguanylate cyclase (GGDEF)-like protein